MTISIIIPIYNVEQYLPSCLDSLLAQTCTHYEVICIDDGSTDRSAAVAKSYEEQFRSLGVDFTLHQQPNHGLAFTRNYGIRQAKGDYILFLDSDDWIEHTTVESLTAAAHHEDLICFNGVLYHEDTHTHDPADSIQDTQGLTGWDYYCQHALESRHFAFVASVLRLYRRGYLLTNNLFFEEGILHEDNRFTPLAYYYAKQIKVISNVLYHYRIRSQSIMTSANVQKAKDLIGTANYLAAFFASIQGINKTTLYRALTHYYQVSFKGNYRSHESELHHLIDWQLYKQVSRTKVRHRLQYIALKINPTLFRFVNKTL